MKKLKNILIILLQVLSLVISFEFIFKRSITLYPLNPFYASLLIGLIFSLIKSDKLKDLTKSKRVLVYIFTIFMLVGEIIDSTGDFLNLFRFKYIILTIIKSIGFYFLFTNNLKVLDYLIFYKERKSTKNKWFIKYEDMLERHPFRVSFISIFIIISIFMIVFYPIVLSPDPSYQIKMYYNVPTKYINWVIQRNENVFMTNHHPILQTFMLGWAIDIGRLILNDNFGLFIYTFIQSLFVAFTLANTVSFLKKHNINKKYLRVITFIYIITPMFAFYSVSAVKDTYYTVIFINLILFLYDFVNNKNKLLSINDAFKLFLLSIFLCLFRQNGIYIILILLPVMCIYSLKNISKLSVVFLSLIVFMWGFNNLLIPYLGISDGSIREALSVPFQQTARLVKYHDDIIEDKDKEIIDKVLVYDTLSERYNPDLSDRVKNEFNKYTTSDDLKAYFKVWFKYLLKEPACYINSFLSNTDGYFYPYELNWYFYHNYDDRITTGEKPVNYHFNNLSISRDILSNYAIIFPYIPVIGLISNIGFGLFMILYLICSLIDYKKKEYIIVLIPLIISILVCFVGPANTYFRYAMPYLFVLPTLEILFKKEIEVNL